MKHWWGRTLKWFRTFHVYLTLVALVLLLFFAVSGFMLNHAEWFEAANPTVTKETGIVPASVLAGDRLTVVEYLRSKYHAAGEVTDYQAREDEIAVQFRLPGRQTDTRITKAGGAIEVTHETRGLYGVVADMHRGKDAGVVWKLVIDAMAILVVAATVTGFVMWLGLRTRRKAGLLALAASAVAVAAAIVRAVW